VSRRTKRRSRNPEDLPAAKPPTTAATVEERRQTVEAQAAQGDWLAEYVAQAVRALDVRFGDELVGPPTPRSPRFLRIRR
jgi:hypothetical protein